MWIQMTWILTIRQWRRTTTERNPVGFRQIHFSSGVVTARRHERSRWKQLGQRDCGRRSRPGEELVICVARLKGLQKGASFAGRLEACSPVCSPGMAEKVNDYGR
jgi:hypothetical protein